MPHGSRILLLSALAFAGCQTATKAPTQPLKASVLPGDRPVPGRSETASPVVKNSDFQKKVDAPGGPNPDAAPTLSVPTIPTTTQPAPAKVDPVPPPAPGLGGTPQPPIAESGGPGGLVIPNLIEKK